MWEQTKWQPKHTLIEIKICYFVGFFTKNHSSGGTIKAVASATEDAVLPVPLAHFCTRSRVPLILQGVISIQVTAVCTRATSDLSASKQLQKKLKTTKQREVPLLPACRVLASALVALDRWCTGKSIQDVFCSWCCRVALFRSVCFCSKDVRRKKCLVFQILHHMDSV